MDNINSEKIWLWKKKCITHLINDEADTDKVDLYAKDLHEAKCQLLINKRKITGLKF